MVAAATPPAPATGRLVALALGLGLLLTIGVGIIAERTLTSLEFDIRSRREIGVVRTAVGDLGARLVDAETAQRGYLLTGRTEYLAPLAASRQAILADTALIRQLSARVPLGDTLLSRFAPLITAKYAEIDSTIALDSMGHEPEARAIVVAGAGQKLMDSLRLQVMAGQGQLQMLRDTKSGQEVARSTQARQAIGLGMLVGVIGLVGSGLVIRNQLILRDEIKARLREQRRLLAGVIEAMPLGVIVFDAKARVVQANAQTGRLMGVQVPVGASQAELVESYRSNVAPDDSPVFAALAGRATYRDDIAITVHGRQAPLEIWCGPIRAEAGAVVNAVAVLNDITDRRADQARIEDLNTELAARVRDLEALTKELDAFSHSVSHDLRAPLRAIDGFARMVVEDHGAALPAEAQRKLRVVRDRAQKMGMLIDDLLRLSRVSRSSMHLQVVEMGPLVRRVLTDLADGGQRSAASVEIGILPEALGDPALLQQVWGNLLSNALKYSSKVSAPCIVVSGIRHEGETTYTVKDNGAGFDMAYADKLFGVFQRLHRADEFEGTGVGLAIVQRVVHRHGGRVWADAAPGAGATFSFALPDQAA
jgi:PAS domain S-box-containing protein